MSFQKTGLTVKALRYYDEQCLLTPSYRCSETCFQYDIALKEIKAVNVIALRFTGKYSDLDKYVPLLYQIAKNDCNGNYFNCYYSELSADPAHLGVKAGYICILHSWGSEMNFHPHLHTILLGGGLTSQNKWKDNGNNFFSDTGHFQSIPWEVHGRTEKALGRWTA